MFVQLFLLIYSSHYLRNLFTYLFVYSNARFFLLLFQTESRESAYVNAITAAGVAFEITKGCSTGDWDDCGCDTKTRGKGQSPDEPSWDWGGCSEDVRFGAAFSERYMDPQSEADKLQYLTTLHNNNAGIKVSRHLFE